MGVAELRDLTPFRDFALREVEREFLNHYQTPAESRGPLLCSACPGFVCYAEKTQGNVVNIFSFC